MTTAVGPSTSPPPLQALTLVRSDAEVPSTTHDSAVFPFMTPAFLRVCVCGGGGGGGRGGASNTTPVQGQQVWAVQPGSARKGRARRDPREAGECAGLPTGWLPARAAAAPRDLP